MHLTAQALWIIFHRCIFSQPMGLGLPVASTYIHTYVVLVWSYTSVVYHLCERIKRWRLHNFMNIPSFVKLSNGCKILQMSKTTNKVLLSHGPWGNLHLWLSTLVLFYSCTFPPPSLCAVCNLQVGPASSDAMNSAQASRTYCINKILFKFHVNSTQVLSILPT